MRYCNWLLLTAVCALTFFTFPVVGYAATIDAKSCSLADVTSAISASTYGDTVTVPAGSCTWASTLTITKGINLRGAGTTQTAITSSAGPAILYEPDATSITMEVRMEISGFTFDGNNGSARLLEVIGADSSGTKPAKNLILANNTFQNVVGNPATIWIHGQVRGLIYGNTFDRNGSPLRCGGNNTVAEWGNSAYFPFSYGSADNLYFEDNTIEFTSSFAGGDPGWMYCEQGGRLVARFNTFNWANATSPSEIWDIHGFQNFNYPSAGKIGQTSTMLVEYYDNTLTNAGQYRSINHRGSWGMFFNNTATGSGADGIQISQYHYGEAGGSGCTADVVAAVGPINFIPEVNNSYFFGNTLNGTVKNAAFGDQGCGVAENISFWNYNASFNGSVGIGRGTKSQMPGTCTTGVGFWVTDEGSWNTKLPANTSGRFYKCTSTNTWTLYYTPYTYPHPLQSGSPISLAPPTGLGAVVY